MIKWQEPRILAVVLSIVLLGSMPWGPDRTASGSVLQLSGAGRVRVAQATILSSGQLPLGSAPFTIEAWINPQVHGNNSITGWGTRGVGNQNNGFRLLSGGQVRHYFWSNDVDRTTGDLSPDSGGPNADGWHHLAISFDGVSARQWYLDGQPLGALHVSAAPNVTLDANGLTIGSAQDNSEGFSGWIDEVRIWNTARSAADIRDHFTYALTGSEPGLVGYWTFDGHVEDQSPASHHASREGDAVIRAGVNAPLRSLAADNGLVGYWDFNNPANVGQARVGAPLKAFNGASYSASGQHGGALSVSAASQQFLALQDTNGAEDKNHVPGNFPLGDDSYTVSAWINLNGTGGGNGIVGWGAYGTNGRVNATRTLSGTGGLVNYGWSPSYDYSQTTANLAGAWHHIAAVYDSAASMKRLYLDGVELGSGMTVPDLAVEAKNFRIASTNNAEYFDGRIDDVAVFNRALSPSLITSIAKGASPLHAPLVSLWRFDDPANLGKDSSALGNDLTRQGDAAYSASGRIGGALSLDGNGDFLDSPGFPHGVPTGNTSYTIAAWFKPDVTGTRGIIGWGNYGVTNQVNALRLHSTNGFAHYWWANDLVVGNSGVDLLDGNWHHIAATFDGTTRTLYLDGAVLASDMPSGHNAQPANFRIGLTYLGQNEYFDGLLDDVAVFNLALSRSEILRIMGGDFTGYGIVWVPEPSPLVLLALGALGLGWCRSRRQGRRNVPQARTLSL